MVIADCIMTGELDSIENSVAIFEYELFSQWYLVGDWMSTINRRPTYMVIPRPRFARCFVCLFCSIHVSLAVLLSAVPYADAVALHRSAKLICVVSRFIRCECVCACVHILLTHRFVTHISAQKPELINDRLQFHIAILFFCFACRNTWNRSVFLLHILFHFFPHLFNIFVILFRLFFLFRLLKKTFFHLFSFVCFHLLHFIISHSNKLL